MELGKFIHRGKKGFRFMGEDEDGMLNFDLYYFPTGLWVAPYLVSKAEVDVALVRLFSNDPFERSQFIKDELESYYEGMKRTANANPT